MNTWMSKLNEIDCYSLKQLMYMMKNMLGIKEKYYLSQTLHFFAREDFCISVDSGLSPPLLPSLMFEGLIHSCFRKDFLSITHRVMCAKKKCVAFGVL